MFTLGRLYAEEMRGRWQDAENNYREAANKGNSEAQRWSEKNVTVMV